MNKKVLVKIQGRLMGQLSFSGSQYRFDYDRTYITDGGRLFRELSIPSETMYSLFSNTIPEGDRLLYITTYLRSREPMDILSGVIDGQNGFSFELVNEPVVFVKKYVPVSEDVRTTGISRYVLQMPVHIPTSNFRSVNKRIVRHHVKMSFSGVQDKFVAVLDNTGLRMPGMNERGNVIVKPESPDFAFLPQNEMAFMTLHEELFPGTTPFVCLVHDPEVKEKYHFIVERFDMGNERVWFEAAQLMAVSEKDKYSISTEELFSFMEKSLRKDEFQRFVDRYIFCYLTGNEDMHLKNFSISGDEDGQALLSPGYDLLCSKMYGGGDRLALSLGGSVKPGVEEFLEWIFLKGDNLPGRTLRIAKHLLERTQSIVSSMPVLGNNKNKRWQERILRSVLPVCGKTVRFCSEHDRSNFDTQEEEMPI